MQLEGDLRSKNRAPYCTIRVKFRICLPSIWTFKAVGHKKFSMVLHENDSN